MSAIESHCKRPTFDSDGYPTVDTLNEIRNWPHTDYAGLVHYMTEVYGHYGRVWREKGLLKMATGGWSGNEGAIVALKENHVFWAMYWESSHRGGLDVFRLPL